MDIVKSIDTDFPSVKDVAIESASQERALDRQTYTQQDVYQGYNKAIIQNDGQTDRILMGYQKGGF